MAKLYTLERKECEKNLVDVLTDPINPTYIKIKDRVAAINHGCIIDPTFYSFLVPPDENDRQEFVLDNLSTKKQIVKTNFYYNIFRECDGVNERFIYDGDFNDLIDELAKAEIPFNKDIESRPRELHLRNSLKEERVNNLVKLVEKLEKGNTDKDTINTINYLKKTCYKDLSGLPWGKTWADIFG